MHEDKLAQACSKGDIVAQKELFDAYSAALMAICKRYSGDSMEAEDFFQESFMLALKKIKKFKYIGEGSLKAWLSRVTVNYCISALRKQKRFVEYNETKYEEIDEPENEGGEDFYPENRHDMVTKTSFSNDELLQELNKLPEAFKVVFNLFVIEGLKHKEIADMLSIKEKTSKTRLLRAKRMLQTQLYNRCLEMKS